MRVEFIPVIFGVLVLLLGVAVSWDAWGPQYVGPMRERRRRSRTAIDLPGEKIAGLGILLLGVALIGRTWRFETLTVLIGTVLILWGGIRNRKYIREMLLFRGSARRRLDQPTDKPPRMRIR